MSRKSQQSSTDQISTTKKSQTKELQHSHKQSFSPNTTNIFLNHLLETVDELEHCLRADHQQDYKLHMALEKQTERVYDLHACLSNEKQRNQRLVDLIMNVDSPSEEEEFAKGEPNLSGRNVINRWSLNSTKDACDSISPLLMQQRYEELSTSYKYCSKQLIKKEKQLKFYKCEQEMLHSQYDHLINEYRKAQKHFEGLCVRYLRLQKKKNYEIEHLKESLAYASDCIITAQQVLDSSEDHDGSTHFEYYTKEFRQNLQLFIKSLQLCGWKQCQCCHCCHSSHRS